MSEREPHKSNPPDPQNSSPDSSNSIPDKTETFHDFLQDIPVGASLGDRYRIIRLIGAGGMGRVFIAEDQELKIDVAIKMIRPELLGSDAAVERLKNELILARKVSHKNVIRIHDIGEINGLKYLSMSYIPGSSLREVLKENGSLALDRALSIGTQICEGVAAAHQEGVIHRDLKPSNILIDSEDHVFVTDFGIARSFDSPDQTKTGMLLGTPAYFSPEQARGEKADTRSDVYSLGLILYEIFAGELPFRHAEVHFFRTSTPEGLDRTLKKYQPQLPRYLIRVIRRCLDPNLERRYSDAGAVLADLQAKRATEFSIPFIKKNKYYIAAAILILAALAGYIWREAWQKKAPGIVETAPVSDLQSVAVLPFDNQTGNPDLSWIENAMADLLISDLSNSRNLRVIDSDRVYQVLNDLKIEVGSYNNQNMQRLAEILDANRIILGNVLQAGTLLRADAQLLDPANPAKPIYFKAVGKKQDDLFSMSAQLADQIQNYLHPGSYVERPPKSFKVPTSALKEYQLGVNSLREGDYEKATGLFTQSLQLAPRFLGAHFKLSEALEKAGKTEEALEVLQKASTIADSGEEKTLFMIRAQHALLLGDFDKSIKIYDTIIQKYPNDSEVYFQMGLLYEEKGDLKNAVASMNQVVKFDPNHPQAYFHLGKDTILMGEAEKGISQYLVKALSIETQLENDHGKAEVLNAMGVGYERLGRYEDAIRYYNESIAIKEKIGNKKGAAKSLTNIAKIHIFQGEYDVAQKILNRTLAIFEQIQDDQGISDITNMFGVLNEDQGRFPEALDYYKKALRIRKQIGNDRLTAQSYDNVGQIYYLTGQYDSAQVFWEQALALRTAIGEESGIILSLQNMGFLQFSQGQLDKSMKSFLEALDRSRSIKYENAVAVSLGNLGMIYQYDGRYDAALNSYQEAIQILEGLEDKKGVAEFTKWMANAYIDMHSFALAKKKLEEVQKLSGEIGSVELDTDLRILTARLQRLQGDCSGSLKPIEEAIRSAREMDYQKGILTAELEKAWCGAADGQLADSQKLLQHVLKEASRTSDMWLIVESNYALAALNEQAGNYGPSIQYCQKGIAAAEKMGLKPLLLKLHSLSGQSYLGMNNRTAAKEHFQKADVYLEEIRSSSKGKYDANLMEIPEVTEIYTGLNLLGIAKKQS